MSPTPGLEADSVTKIEAAEQAGTIDHDTALEYELYAALDYASLPVEYQSSNPAAPEATTILAELSSASTQLSPDLQAKVAPFFRRPDDPASIWATRSAAQGRNSGSVALAALAAETDCSAGPFFACVDAANTPVRVWYDIAESGAEAEATALAAEIDRSHMWTTEQIAMLGKSPCSDGDRKNNGGDSRLDIYLISTPDFAFDGRRQTLALPGGPNLPPQTADGVTVPEASVPCGVIPYIILNANPTRALKVIAAHELFHAFQYSFKNAPQPDHNWWAEATATWAEDLVYPNENTERVFLNGYWSDAAGPEGPLDTFIYGQDPQYAAYLWPFYLRQKLGSTDGSVIGQLWQASETEDPLDAIANLDGWPDKWKEFALWNWNRDDPQLIKYRDNGEIIPPEALSQLTACMSETDGCETKTDGSKWSLLANGKHDILISLKHASVQYLTARPDVDVEKLSFDLSGVQAKPGIGVQALMWIGDPDSPSEIKVEDWSDLAKRDVCVKSDDVRKIVLVVSNSNVGGTFSDSIKVEGLPNGCSGWRGTMSITTSWNVPNCGIIGSSCVGTSTSTFDGLWALNNDPLLEPYDCPGGDHPCISYVPSGTITWTWESHDQASNCSETFAGTFPADPASNQAFALVSDGAGHYGYFGHGGWPAPAMKCESPRGVNSPPSFFDVSADSAGTGAADGTGNTCAHTTWLIDAATQTIAGSCYDVNNGPNTVLETWNLAKVGNAIP